MRRIVQHRFGAVVIFYLLYLSIAFCTRMTLLIATFGSVDKNPLKLLGVFLCGAVYDVAAAAYMSLPLVLLFWLWPKKRLGGRVLRVSSQVVGFVIIYLLLFGAVAQWFFWEEFSCRFNFIAVDYLVYTTEVLGNIQESYPLPAILGGLAVLTAIVWYGVWKTGLVQSWWEGAVRNPARLVPGTILLLIPLIGQFTLSNRNVPEFGNSYNQELARDGLYSLFAAYWANELSYDRFYATVPIEDAFKRLRPLLKESNTEFVNSDLKDITRHVNNPGKEKRWNVIQITIESLSGEFLGVFGSELNITPNIDRLYGEGIAFDQLYATGTRTVRGMEALTLSVPPTPGQSIVRRPDNANMFSLGSIMRSRGYDTVFIYSGFGYFDNMNAFFAANGYRILDRSKVSNEDITHANIWGACDEDLYRWTMREADKDFAEGKPFDFFLMTTSNHRPYTFPDGKIDLAPGNRGAAVKYTDYALDQFLKTAQSKPWFTNTLFLIVADHCAGAAGKTALPLRGYRIPALFWNPTLVSPRKVERVVSQIDLPPTLLGLLNWSYDTRFYGKDALKMRAEDERAFISTYQKMGYLRNARLALLEPMARQREYQCQLPIGPSVEIDPDAEFIDEAISCYQTASYLFSHGMNRADVSN